MIPLFRRLTPFLFIGAALVAPVLMRSNHAVVWAQEVAATSYAPAFGWNGDMGQYVTAAIQDSRGDVWVATEDKGVWHRDAQIQKWTNFSVGSGLGDDTAYCLAEDAKGRIWAGTLSHGVSVWNGQSWKNYGPLDGPMGERVFALASNPSNGDMWVATNGGLTRYDGKRDRWQGFTRAQGLPSDQIQALACDSVGNVYAGTQCDGVAVGKGDDYARWTTVRGPRALPNAPLGEGLPSSQINDLLITDDDTVWAATQAGIAQSKDFGETWNFLRGGDWEERQAGLFSPAPATKAPGRTRELLGEDYVSSLAEDSRGLVWAGYRLHGFQIRRPIPDRVLFETKADTGGNFPYASAFVPLRDGRFLVAFYGRGLTMGPPVPAWTLTPEEQKAAKERRGWKAPSQPIPLDDVAFPSPAKPLDANELDALTKRIAALSTPLKAGDAQFLGDDWRTRGDWVGRYGRYYSVLCAIQAPIDDTYASLMPFPEVVPQLGPHFQGDDSIRRWIHWVKTEDGRTLYDPFLGYRRQAEWDDHGETYPMTFEGPDLWSSLQVPPGTWRITSYFFNKDGHDGYNRARDYQLELRQETTPLPPYPAPKDGEQVTGEWLQTYFGAYYAARSKIIEQAQKTAPIATARVHDFWGGVHKSFVVQGPATYWFRVSRNGSFNTIVSSLMWDEITPGKRWEEAPGLSWTGGKFNPPDPDEAAPINPFLLDDILSGQYQEPTPPTDADKKRAEVVKAARALWDASDAAMDKQDGAKWQWQARLSAYRAAQANGASNVLLENWRWKMPLWIASDRAQWNDAMKRAAQSYAIKDPTIGDAKQ